MQRFTTTRWSLFLISALLFGCSSLHVQVGSTVNWSEVKTVTLQTPAQDPWHLEPAIRSELGKLGFGIVTENGSPDLVVRYFFQDGPDLNADGDILTRLKSIHIQFVDPGSDAYVAVADYFYEDSLSDTQTDAGVQAAFAELRRNIQTGKPQQPQTAPATIRQSKDNTPVATEQSVLPNNSTTASQQAGMQGQEHQSTEQPLMETTTSAAIPPADLSQTQPVPVTNRQTATEIVPEIQSPWIPRFDSWGFESWGKDNEGIDPY